MSICCHYYLNANLSLLILCINLILRSVAFRNLISLSNYEPSSKEGANNRHLAPPGLCFCNVCNIGMANAAVLPDPVGAKAIRLRLARIIGIAAI